MEVPFVKTNLLRNILARLLSFCVLILAIRFAYLVTITGGSCRSRDFCFFSDNLSLRPTVSNTPGRETLENANKYPKTVDYFSSVFQDLVAENFLSPTSKSLCLDTSGGEDVHALRELGFSDSIGISEKASPPFIVYGKALSQPFDADTFDFEFARDGTLDRSLRPMEFGSEVCRTLKPGAFFVAHTMARDEYSLNSILDLFNCCRLVRSLEIDGLESLPVVREIVMRKEMEIPGSPSGNSSNHCRVSAIKQELIRTAEPLIQKEPLKPWITLKRNIKNVKYLSSAVDISFKQRYVYIDVGSRSYGSSIVSWFKKQYPKQKKTFEIYAIEADRAFHNEYKSKKGITLLPHAAWVRNETLFFEITRDPSKKVMEKGRGMGRIQPVQSSASYMADADRIQGFDFAGWLKSAFSSKDFVVMKMDVEGTEFELIPRLIETGAICLVDEIFLECHYNRWQRCCPGQRSTKYQKTYAQCLQLFTSLRQSGVLVHQWW